MRSDRTALNSLNSPHQNPKNAKAAEAAKNVLSRAAPRDTTINAELAELADLQNQNPKNAKAAEAAKILSLWR